MASRQKKECKGGGNATAMPRTQRVIDTGQIHTTQKGQIVPNLANSMKRNGIGTVRRTSTPPTVPHQSSSIKCRQVSNGFLSSNTQIVDDVSTDGYSNGSNNESGGQEGECNESSIDAVDSSGSMDESDRQNRKRNNRSTSFEDSGRSANESDNRTRYRNGRSFSVEDTSRSTNGEELNGSYAQVKNPTKRGKTHLSKETFSCQYKGCSLSYVSHHSRQLHYRLKHDGGGQTVKPADSSKVIVTSTAETKAVDHRNVAQIPPRTKGLANNMMIAVQTSKRGLDSNTRSVLAMDEGFTPPENEWRGGQPQPRIKQLSTIANGFNVADGTNSYNDRCNLDTSTGEGEGSSNGSKGADQELPTSEDGSIHSIDAANRDSSLRTTRQQNMSHSWASQYTMDAGRYSRPDGAAVGGSVEGLHHSDDRTIPNGSQGDMSISYYSDNSRTNVSAMRCINGELRGSEGQLLTTIDGVVLDMSKVNQARRRRKKSELKRSFACLYKDCRRTYASNHARHLHARLKHKHDEPLSDCTQSVSSMATATRSTTYAPKNIPNQVNIESKNLESLSRPISVKSEMASSNQPTRGGLQTGPIWSAEQIVQPSQQKQGQGGAPMLNDGGVMMNSAHDIGGMTATNPYSRMQTPSHSWVQTAAQSTHTQLSRQPTTCSCNAGFVNVGNGFNNTHQMCSNPHEVCRSRDQVPQQVLQYPYQQQQQQQQIHQGLQGAQCHDAYCQPIEVGIKSRKRHRSANRSRSGHRSDSRMNSRDVVLGTRDDLSTSREQEHEPSLSQMRGNQTLDVRGGMQVQNPTNYGVCSANSGQHRSIDNLAVDTWQTDVVDSSRLNQQQQQSISNMHGEASMQSNPQPSNQFESRPAVQSCDCQSASCGGNSGSSNTYQERKVDEGYVAQLGNYSPSHSKAWPANGGHLGHQQQQSHMQQVSHMQQSSHKQHNPRIHQTSSTQQSSHEQQTRVELHEPSNLESRPDINAWDQNTNLPFTIPKTGGCGCMGHTHTGVTTHNDGSVPDGPYQVSSQHAQLNTEVASSQACINGYASTNMLPPMTMGRDKHKRARSHAHPRPEIAAAGHKKKKKRSKRSRNGRHHKHMSSRHYNVDAEYTSYGDANMHMSRHTGISHNALPNAYNIYGTQNSSSRTVVQYSSTSHAGQMPIQNMNTFMGMQEQAPCTTSEFVSDQPSCEQNNAREMTSRAGYIPSENQGWYSNGNQDMNGDQRYTPGLNADNSGPFEENNSNLRYSNYYEVDQRAPLAYQSNGAYMR
ncbi:hypothetical protein SARC_08311 [Sphaeroforma arctica JP610]|uniref:C2H2-type domain-containing protein n=1 Tax=Sphaeroforma arctica JP610 TaxID=667725 RepID=A0A0L0FR96_9EUKA|nr:hypothetical protein SARC_08311 [Sphaeroforma arctica JP610]KNC79295.1 hypothetical protein SARC_08311 [Sphaeroforma arctica JP610]|eukprot:XP_014153197.1 hypothetical protein SARC_08311 [Sphaeroforma arctica JP610]